MPSIALNELRGLRRHWLIATLVLLAAVLRAVVLAAYRPALIFPAPGSGPAGRPARRPGAGDRALR